MSECLLSELTVVILTYRTNREILSNCLKSLDERVKVKIVENSESFENRKYQNPIGCTLVFGHFENLKSCENFDVLKRESCEA